MQNWGGWIRKPHLPRLHLLTWKRRKVQVLFAETVFVVELQCSCVRAGSCMAMIPSGNGFLGDDELGGSFWAGGDRLQATIQ